MSKLNQKEEKKMKKLLSLVLAVVMVLGMIPAMNLAASAEEAQSAPAPLWSEDFQSYDGLSYSSSSVSFAMKSRAICNVRGSPLPSVRLPFQTR